MQGKLYVIEGACDGMGKTTQYCLLKERLLNEKQKVVSHHFPSYQTYQGKPVEEYLSGSYGSVDDLSPYFVNGLYAMDRAITWHTYLKEKYEDNQVILLDRYTTSSLIYQSALFKTSAEKKAFIDYVCDFEYNKLGIKEPDKTIFLTAPFDLVASLRNNRVVNDGIKNDLHESDIEYMKKVYENSMFVSEYLKWETVDCQNDKQMDSIKNIHKKVYTLIKS